MESILPWGIAASWAGYKVVDFKEFLLGILKPFFSCLAGSKVAIKSHAALTSSTFYMTSLLFSLEAFTVSSLTWHFEISNSQDLAVGLLSPPAGALPRPGDRALAASLLSPHLALSALGRSALILCFLLFSFPLFISLSFVLLPGIFPSFHFLTLQLNFSFLHLHF